MTALFVLKYIFDPKRKEDVLSEFLNTTKKEKIVNPESFWLQQGIINHT